MPESNRRFHVPMSSRGPCVVDGCCTFHLKLMTSIWICRKALFAMLSAYVRSSDDICAARVTPGKALNPQCMACRWRKLRGFSYHQLPTYLAFIARHTWNGRMKWHVLRVCNPVAIQWSWRTTSYKAAVRVQGPHPNCNSLPTLQLMDAASLRQSSQYR